MILFLFYSSSFSVAIFSFTASFCRKGQLRIIAVIIENTYFAHYIPGEKTPWQWLETNRYPYKTAGENLARGFQKPEEVLTAWLNSPSHRKNLLNPDFRDIGLAVVPYRTGEKNSCLIVEIVGATKKEEASTGQLEKQ